LTINRLPDEVLLEIFDSYRQTIDPYDLQWRKKSVWLNLAHACRRWHAVIFASSSRLDLGINVGPQKPDYIKKTLSSGLSIFIEYKDYQFRNISGSALWRLRAALRYRDRVRKISFGGCAVSALSFGTFFKATNYHFPALESLDLSLPYNRELDIPATFLRGPDQLDLRLRCLKLSDASLSSVSGLLLSATALTDLKLSFTCFDSSQRSSLLSYLQCMQSLHSLDLTTPSDRRSEHSTYSTPKDIDPFLKLTRFHFTGSKTFLDNFMSGLSAPSLQDARFVLSTRAPILYLSKVIDDVSEDFRSVSVTFDLGHFYLLSSTQSGKIDYLKLKPSFRFNLNCYPESIYTTPSMKLAVAEELALFFTTSYMNEYFSLREFLRQFRSVRVLRVDPFIRQAALSLQQDDGEAILPVLEEIEVSISRLTKNSEEEYERHAAEALAAFEPFVSARERAGRLVKVTIVRRRHAIKAPKW
jgi:F-box-like